jgi:hypothetical protein
VINTDAYFSSDQCGVLPRRLISATQNPT